MLSQVLEAYIKRASGMEDILFVVTGEHMQVLGDEVRSAFTRRRRKLVPVAWPPNHVRILCCPSSTLLFTGVEVKMTTAVTE